jgi:hypothetical protein
MRFGEVGIATEFQGAENIGCSDPVSTLLNPAGRLICADTDAYIVLRRLLCEYIILPFCCKL